MEDYEQARETAYKKIKVADHILTMTYPLVNDPKLLKLVLKNIYEGMQATMACLLHHERLYKRIPTFHESYGSMLHLVRPQLKKYGISTEYVEFLAQLQEVMNFRKEADVEFVRKEKFVFASKEYDLNHISQKEIKDYLIKAKLFMNQITGVVEENERITRKR